MPQTRSELNVQADMMKIFEVGQKFKKVMLKKNLRRARTECPFCKQRDDVPEGKGFIFGVLRPQKRSNVGFHLHMKCDGPCGAMMME